MKSLITIDLRTTETSSRFASGYPKPGIGFTGRARFFIVFLVANIILFTPLFSDALWYDSNWAHRNTVTINDSQVSGDARTDFLVLISLTDINLSAARADGFDPLLTESDEATKLNH